MDVTSGTGEFLAIPVAGLCLSILVFWFVKYHSRKPSMLRTYHINATESSANGLTNVAMVKVTMVIFALICINYSVFTEVS